LRTLKIQIPLPAQHFVSSDAAGLCIDAYGRKKILKHFCIAIAERKNIGCISAAFIEKDVSLCDTSQGRRCLSPAVLP
jgi:hypothetical protein